MQTTQNKLGDEPTINNIIAILQDAQGTDYIDESVKMIQEAINMLLIVKSEFGGVE